MSIRPHGGPPLITAIEIENFKGIGPRQRIELRPITLLFGPNSAGKSSILHAILFAQEAFARRNFDAGQTARGGEFVDLGGFCNFVHNRDPNRSVVIRVELDMSNVELPMYTEVGTEVDDIPDKRFSEVITQAYVEITLRWSVSAGQSYCTAYEVGINGDKLGTLSYEPGRPGAKPVARIELRRDHPLWNHVEYKKYTIRHNALELDDPSDDMRRESVHARELLSHMQSSINVSDDALPTWFTSLDFGFAGEFVEDQVGTERVSWDPQFHDDVSRLLVGPGQAARDALMQFQYLGPLREKPARNYEPPRYPDPSRWSSGLGGWDELQLGDETLVHEVSEWLSRSNRLATGYSLHRLAYRELDVSDPSLGALASGRGFDEADLEDARAAIARMPIRRRLVLRADGSKEQLLPHDVGEGISQVVPVVVAVLADRKGSIMIEQPELHVHPAVQVGLGDLLIEGLRDRGGIMLIETHSEHLLLRLLRRVREATAKALPADHVSLKPDQLAVYYLDAEDRAVTARRLRVTEEGEFIDRWPRGFFEERIEEI